MSAITIDEAMRIALEHHWAGRLREAEVIYRQLLAHDPNHARALHMLGTLAIQTGFPDAAVELLRRAIVYGPPDADYQNNLGRALQECGQLTEALGCFREAIRIKPEYDRAHGSLLYLLHFLPEYDARAIWEELRLWNEKFALPLQKQIRPHGNDRAPGRRLRIGYISPDFRSHIVARNMVPLFSEHDRGQVEIFCYASVAVADAMTERFRGWADQWRDIVGVSDDAAAELIRADRIDILVDLTLHMAGNRLLVLARKPAPVQVTFAGYPGSTGMDTIDYRLTDPYLDPVRNGGGADDAYAEESFRLPHSFWCYESGKGDPEVQALPRLTSGTVTFGCLNNFCKVNGAVLELWARVLHAVAGARLMLLAPEGGHRKRTIDALGGHGIASDRVTFVGYRARAEYLQLYHQIDIGLDTLPYNGHSTSLDSFWMGVPVVTLAGQTVAGRAGLSQLMNLKMPELIAQSPEEYVRIAAGLAGDLPRLAGLRAGLRERMRVSPLMDAAGLARGIEAAYRDMWKKWCGSAGEIGR